MQERNAPRPATLSAVLSVVAVVLALASCKKQADPEMPSEPVRTPASGSGTPLFKLSPSATPAAGEAEPTPALAGGAGGDAAKATPAEAAHGASGKTPAKGALAPTETAVRERIEAWRAAWQKKDLEAYLAFYARGFRGDGLDLAGWRDRKTRVFAKAGDIKVEVSGLKIGREGALTVARFTQAYTSGTHTDRGKKELRLVEEGGALRIVSEKFEE